MSDHSDHSDHSDRDLPRDAAALAGHLAVARGQRRQAARRAQRAELLAARAGFDAALRDAKGDPPRRLRAQYVYHIDQQIAALRFRRDTVGEGDTPAERHYRARLDMLIDVWKGFLVVIDCAALDWFTVGGEGVIPGAIPPLLHLDPEAQDE